MEMDGSVPITNVKRWRVKKDWLLDIWIFDQILSCRPPWVAAGTCWEPSAHQPSLFILHIQLLGLLYFPCISPVFLLYFSCISLFILHIQLLGLLYFSCIAPVFLLYFSCISQFILHIQLLALLYFSFCMCMFCVDAVWQYLQDSTTGGRRKVRGFSEKKNCWHTLFLLQFKFWCNLLIFWKAFGELTTKVIML